MVALPSPQDIVTVELKEKEASFGGGSREVDEKLETVADREKGDVGGGDDGGEEEGAIEGVIMWRAGGSGQQSDGMGVLLKLMRSNFANGVAGGGGVAAGDAVGLGVGTSGCAEHWRGVTVVSICGLGLSVLPVEVTQLPLLEKLYLDNNKLSTLPPELGGLKNLKVLAVDFNQLVSVPVELIFYHCKDFAIYLLQMLGLLQMTI